MWNVKDFLPEDSTRNTLTKIEKRNIGRRFIRKLRTNSTIERTAGSLHAVSENT